MIIISMDCLVRACTSKESSIGSLNSNLDPSVECRGEICWVEGHYIPFIVLPDEWVDVFTEREGWTSNSALVAAFSEVGWAETETPAGLDKLFDFFERGAKNQAWIEGTYAEVISRCTYLNRCWDEEFLEPDPEKDARQGERMGSYYYYFSKTERETYVKRALQIAFDAIPDMDEVTKSYILSSVTCSGLATVLQTLLDGEDFHGLMCIELMHKWEYPKRPKFSRAVIKVLQDHPNFKGFDLNEFVADFAPL
jgi:hypothetical protein